MTGTGAAASAVGLRDLPTLVAASVRLVRAAAGREFVVVTALQGVGAAGLGAVLVVGQRVLAAVLAAEGTGQLGPVLAWLGLLVVVISAVVASSSVARSRDEVLGQLVTRHAQRRILDVAGAVDLAAFEHPEFHDRLQRVATSGQTKPFQLVQGLLSLVSGGLGILGVATALLTVEPLLAPIVLAAAIPLWLAAARRGQTFFELAVAQSATQRERTYLFGLVTSREAAKEVRGFGLLGFLRGRWDRVTDTWLQELRATVRAQRVLAITSGLAVALLIGLALAALAWLSTSGRMTLAEAGTAGGAVLLLGTQLVSSAIGADLLYDAAPLVRDLDEFLAMEPALTAARPTTAAPAGFEQLVVDDVAFSYPASDRRALDGVSFTLRAGEVVALVGENGSGKTTLATLLAGLYQPEAGRITWDGVDTATLDPEGLRRGVAVLFQDFLHYRLPARDNIGVGRVDAADDLAAIVAAATEAGADDVLRTLPRGYDTVLSPEFDGGEDLSGGQWQRIALARAFFRDAPLLILDEPTAALDARAEHALFERVRALAAGRTVVLISHRFSSVRSADRILVLHEGRLVEEGDHATLTAQGGRYAELYALQAASYA